MCRRAAASFRAGASRVPGRAPGGSFPGGGGPVVRVGGGRVLVETEGCGGVTVAARPADAGGLAAGDGAVQAAPRVTTRPRPSAERTPRLAARGCRFNGR